MRRTNEDGEVLSSGDAASTNDQCE